MGQLRAIRGALLLTGAEPAQLLEELDSVAELTPNCVLPPSFSRFSNTNSGDSPTVAPAICPRAGGAAAGPTLITDARSVPLAVHRKKPRPQASVVLQPARH